jgi:hypothetical protein
VPKGAEQKQVRDVDGDGKGDTLYLNAAGSAGIQLGIQTASGAQLVAGVSTAAPVGPSAVVIDPTGTGSPLDVIVQSREAYVYTISGCQLVPVKDSKGAPYVFGMGWSGIGTGMGCSTVTGRTGLVGLDAKKQADGSWSITRTAVIQTGTTAANGPSDTVKAAEGSAALKSAQGIVSCGDVTMAEDGVSVTG